jgi:hypothetical protein
MSCAAFDALAIRPALNQDLQQLEDFIKALVAHHETQR